MKTDPSSVPELSGIKLKKIRRALYKNLLADGLIAYKGMLVDMQLMTDKIIINDKMLPAKLIEKYHNLTDKIGTGPIRKIKMSSDFVLAGDFTSEGFKGSGVGRFSKELMETDKELFEYFSIDEQQEGEKVFLEMESKALTLFAKEIQVTFPDDIGKKRLFGVNLKGEEAEKLHAELEKMLTEDNFIGKKGEFAVIQLPEKIIRINGKEITAEQFQKYHLLAEKYGIKNGRHRMILFSPHILKVGNFLHGNFTGTIITLPLQD